MSISGHQRRSRLCGREDKFSGGKTIGHEMPLGISNPCGIIGILRAEPLGEGVRGRREKMADQVRHDEAAEARGRLPPFTDCSALLPIRTCDFASLSSSSPVFTWRLRLTDRGGLAELIFSVFRLFGGDFPLSETRKSAIFDA